MIIAIFGLTGSGKNTVGELLAKELGYTLVCPTFKDLAKEEGISLLEFQKKASKDPLIDKKFDELLKKQASGKNCVVVTWLGPWMLNCTARIGLVTSSEERAKRVAKREGVTYAQALEFIEEKDEGNKKRYKKVYGIDIENQQTFDAWINTEKYKPAQIVEIIKKLLTQVKT